MRALVPLGLLGLAIALLASSTQSAAADAPDAPDFLYALQDGAVVHPAHFEKEAGREPGVGVMSFGGLAVPCAGLGAQLPAGSRVALTVTTDAARMAYVTLYALQAWGYYVGTVLLFDLDGVHYAAQLQVHRDGPGGPRPFDHLGVDLHVYPGFDLFTA